MRDSHCRGRVRGALVEETGDVAELDLEALPEGNLHLIAAYD